MTLKNQATKSNLKADIVIVGGGASGLAAAVKAAESGAKKITLIEVRPVIGGNAVRAGAVWAVDSPTQRRFGEHYSKDQAFWDKMWSTNWKLDPRVIRTLINVSGEVIGWLESKGLSFDLRHNGGYDTDLRDGAYPYTFHTAQPLPSGKKMGAAMIEVVERDAQKLGVNIITGTTGQKLVTDTSGKITGIIATQKGTEIKIDTKAVIIAAGGFAGNKKLLRRFFGEEDAQQYTVSLPHGGEGIIMAEEVGAVVDDCVAHLNFGPHHYKYAFSLNCFIRRPESIHVNKLGERFIDESVWMGFEHLYGGALNRQLDQTMYALIDDTKLRDIIERKETWKYGSSDHLGRVWGTFMGVDALFSTTLDDFKKDETKGAAKIANTWDEMAKFIGCKPEVLKATVEQYNSYCENGYDADFLKPREFLFPLRTPPYYAIVGWPGFDVTFGGIKVNARMEVINKQWEVIKGLYAVGNNAGSMYITPYTSKYMGTSMGFAYYSGYIAGREAAKYVLGLGKG